jgi:hypothetical protein
MSNVRLIYAMFLVLLAACSTQGARNTVIDASDLHWANVNGKDCQIYALWPNAGKSVDWSGTCSHGFAAGQGTAAWHEMDGTELVVSGTAVNGLFQGAMVLDERSLSMHVHEQVTVTDEVANGFGTYESDTSGIPIIRYSGNFAGNVFSGVGRAYVYQSDGIKVQDGIWTNGQFASGKASIIGSQSPAPTPAPPQVLSPAYPGQSGDSNLQGLGTTESRSAGDFWSQLTPEDKKSVNAFIDKAGHKFLYCKLYQKKETGDCIKQSFNSGIYAAGWTLFCSSPSNIGRFQRFVNSLRPNLVSDGLRDEIFAAACHA